MKLAKELVELSTSSEHVNKQVCIMLAKLQSTIRSQKDLTLRNAGQPRMGIAAISDKTQRSKGTVVSIENKANRRRASSASSSSSATFKPLGKKRKRMVMPKPSEHHHDSVPLDCAKASVNESPICGFCTEENGLQLRKCLLLDSNQCVGTGYTHHMCLNNLKELEQHLTYCSERCLEAAGDSL